MNDLFLILAGIVFLFVLWVYNGGPNNPISFAGPFITPISGNEIDLGTSSESVLRAQGDGRDSFNGGGSSGYGGGGSSGGSIRIGSGNVSATSVAEEYLTIRNDGSNAVAISGWTIKSAKSGAHVTIPNGYRIAESGSAGAIVLAPGDEAMVETGASPIGESFKESLCTGYLSANHSFSPGLGNRCPSPLDELGTWTDTHAPEYDRCAAYARSVPTCRQPGTEDAGKAPASCRDFLSSRLSYGGCIAAHAGETAFFDPTWHIYLGQARELWRGDSDVIQLMNASGTLVDQYAY